jgi:lysophospholipase L1-like esterase
MQYFRYRHYERLRYSTKFRKWLVTQAARLGMEPKVVFDTLLVKGKMTMTQVGKYTKPVTETRLIGAVGDSRVEFSFNKPGGRNTYFRNVGIFPWISALSAGVLHCPIEANAGVRSDTTAMILARVPAHISTCKALGITRVVYLGGTNDRPNIAVATTMANILAAIKLYNDAGISVDLISELPRGNGSSSYELTTQGKADHYASHVQMEALRGTNPKLTVIDAWSKWVDPASGTNYYILPGLSYDQIHPGKPGAKGVADVSTPQLLQETGMTATLLPLTAAIYNATSAPQGSLLLNPLMTGTTGAKASGASAITGTFVPTNWTLDASNITGLTITGSQVQLGDFTYVKLDFSGTIDAAVTGQPLVQLKQTITAGNMAAIAVGDKLKTFGGVAFTGTGLSNVGHSLLLLNVFQQMYDTEDSEPTYPYPVMTGSPVKMSRESPTYTHDSGIVSMELRLEAQLLSKQRLTDLGLTVNCSVYFGQTKLMKV